MENRNILMGVISVTILFVVVFGIAVIITWPQETERETALAEVTSDGSGEITSWYREGHPPQADAATETGITNESGEHPPQAEEIPADKEGEAPLLSEDAPGEETISAAPIQLETKTGGPIKNITYVKKRPEKPSALTTSSREIRPSEGRTTTTTTKPKTITKPVPRRVTEFWIQAGSFTSRSSAESQNNKLVEKGFSGQIQTYDKNDTLYYRVRIGPYTKKGEADKFLSWIQEIKEMEGSYISEVYVIR